MDVDLDLGAGRLDALEAAAVDAAKDLAGHDLVGLGDLVEDLCTEPVEGGAEAIELLAHTLGTGTDPGWAAVVDDVGVQQLGEGSLVGTGLVFVDEATHDGLGIHAWTIARPPVCGASVDLPILGQQVVFERVKRRGGAAGDPDPRVDVLNVAFGRAS